MSIIIDTSRFPTHLAMVVKRLNVCSPDDPAARFLEASYVAETFLKTIAIVVHSGLAKPVRDISYRYAYQLVRGDGLGTWEQAIREMTAQPTAGYLPPEFFPSLAWISKKRTKPEDDWFRMALRNARNVLALLGAEEQGSNAVTVKELITCLVQIRNKTKAHGAVSEDFYTSANDSYIECLTAILNSCPILEWRWLHLSMRETGKVRGVNLLGMDPRHLRDSEVVSFTVDAAGVYFVPTQSVRTFYCGDLLRSNRECTQFLLPNGGLNQTGTSEYIDYATGKTSKESAQAYLLPPVPLPHSETQGLETFDIQSNSFGNLPQVPTGYVQRKALEEELAARLLDKNHPIITLHGGGGMGKTSLALAVAHALSKDHKLAFEHVIWFSARDVDLRATGPSEVRPSVVDLQSVSKQFGRLFSDWGAGAEPEALARALQSPSSVSSKAILFIFDNFETFADVRGLHKFLDQHTHLPNKALITSRDRAFVADYPIEVRGMEIAEAERMLVQSARALGVEQLMTSAIIDQIFEDTGGHAYVMRVLVGEIAKDGRYTRAAQVIGRRQDIVDAVFERSFNRLTDAGRHVFLLVANWKSHIPEVALLVVLGVRGIDAIAGIDECRRLSLIYPIEASSNQIFYSVPPLARGFAHKKLQGDPDRLVIQHDLATLQKFGVVPVSVLGGDTESRLITQFATECFEEIDKGAAAIARADKLLEGLANSWAPGWKKLADFRKRSGADQESVAYALRRAVEEEPFSKAAWLDRAQFAKECGDEGLRIASLVSAVDADPNDVDLVREVAFQLSRYIKSHLSEIPRARRGVYLASVRAHMERLAPKLDGDGLSRLAWLFLLEENVSRAREYAEKGLTKDPANLHCTRILERLDGQN